MKHYVILLLVVFYTSTAKAVEYVTVTDDCPVITFSSTTLKRMSVLKSNIKVQKTDSYVIVTIMSADAGVQIITWNTAQADSYGGRNLTTLYNYILTLITTSC